jgi:NADPH:quinone reductase-like Zn-dependent oxidoreductase
MINPRLLVLVLLLPSLAAAQETMTAIRVHEFGKPDVLKLEQIAKPTPGDGDLLVHVFAAGVNPVDWRIRAGPGRGAALPYTPGFDVSGVVEKVGPNVSKFKAGDAVFAMMDLRRGGGGYAEYAIVKENEAAPKPAKISHADAASVPLVALTAWQALFDTAHLEKGQTVLIHAGAGGVGSMAIQLAKWKGAHVIATASKDNLDFLKQLGADDVIDYQNQKFSDVAKDVDVVLDPIGGDTQAQSWALMKKGGILVSLVGRPSPQKVQEAGVRGTSILVKSNSDELAQIGQLIDDGKIHPVVTYLMPLAQAAQAHEQSETHHTRGKIVLQVVTTQPATAPAP